MNGYVRYGLILMLFWSLVGCVNTLQFTQEELPDSKEGDVSVATKAGKGYRLTNYYIQSDTLCGIAAQRYSAQWVYGDSLRIPLAEITYVEVRESGATMGTAGLIALVFIALMVGIGFQQSLGSISWIMESDPVMSTGSFMQIHAES